MNTKLTTKAGRITRYGLACGYVETFAQGAFNARLHMPSPSAGIIMVQADNDPDRILYSGRNMKAARHAYDSYRRDVRHAK